MKILLVGSGGREHALAWKIAQSPLVTKIYCTPGNAGIFEVAEFANVGDMSPEAVADFAEENGVDLTVIGAEAPLVAGIVNEFEARGLQIFGPSKEAAEIEGSKIFAKEVMRASGVPTAKAEMFHNYEEASKYVTSVKTPHVIKADGLAAGKGVSVCFETQDALDALRNCFVSKKFGAAGEKVLVEEYLHGDELSLLCLTDGERLLPMVPAQDYKRLLEGDKGPNTGGMGSYSPVPVASDSLCDEIVREIFKPVVDELRKAGRTYRGVLYGGLILTNEGPKVLEFNVRFGDPETQAMLPRLESDLLETMLAVARRELHGVSLRWKKEVCVTVVLTAEGYPEKYQTGLPIKGLHDVRDPNVHLFHAGTKSQDGRVETAGGRVLNVSALGRTFEEARRRVYGAIRRIDFEGMTYRRDIAVRAAKHETGLATDHQAVQEFRGAHSGWMEL